MSKEKGGLWREEELRLLRDYFDQDIEAEASERIKQLTLAKIEQLPSDVKKGQAEQLHLISIWLKSIRQWSRSVWWRWQWKIVLPFIVLFILAGAGYEWNHIVYSLHPTSSHSTERNSSALEEASSGRTFSTNNMPAESAPKSADAKDSAVVMKDMSIAGADSGVTAKGSQPQQPNTALQSAPPVASSDALSHKPKSLLHQIWLYIILIAAVGGGIWMWKRGNKGSGKKH